MDGRRRDVDNIDVPDVDTLQQAMNRAIERRNMVRFPRLAALVLGQAQQESADGSAVAGCIGVALGLLDQWLPGHDRSIPADLGKLTRLPAGHWTGERAAADIVTLPCPIWRA